MFDLGVLTLPILAAAGVLGLALVTGETISIDPIVVASNLEAAGYDSTVITRQLTDEIRELNAIARSDIEQVDIDGTPLEQSVGQFEAYFGLAPLVDGGRDLLGLVPYAIDGELTGDPQKVTMTVRVRHAEGDLPVVDVSRSSGPAANLHAILHEAALEVVGSINPYVVALYWRRVEEAEGSYDFPMTRAVLDRFLEEQPVNEHFLAYGLFGRTFMLKAERLGTASPGAQEAAYAEAALYFEAALVQRPDFQYAAINLAIVRAAQGRHEEADAYFAKAVELDPNALTARVRWAESLDGRGRVRDAAFQWVAAVEIHGDDPLLRRELAEDYAILGMVDEARAQLEHAAILDPMHAPDYRRQLDELTARAD